jgi:hypothetical protein
MSALKGAVLDAVLGRRLIGLNKKESPAKAGLCTKGAGRA